MGVNWNTQQQEVIAHRNGNLLVSAAAGSGKTAVLTEHVLQRLKDPVHPMEIDRLLIMTFTNAAAAEMKGRIRKALQDEIDSANCDDEMRRHLRKQLVKLPFAAISTIHSFCLNVIHENFFRIGLEPNLTVSDEAATKLLLADVIDAVLEPYYMEDDSEAFLSLSMLHKNRKKPLSRAIEEFYGKSREYPDPEEFLNGAVEVYSGDYNEQLRKDLDAYEKKKIRPLLRAKAEAEMLADELAAMFPDSRHIETIEKIADVADSAYRKATLAEAVAYLKEPANKIPPINLNKAEKEYTEFYDHIRAEKNRISAIINAVKKLTPLSWDTMEKELSRLLPQVKLMTEIVRKVDEDFQLQKKRLRLMDFADMEHYALKLLEDEKVAGIYQKRFEEILVDEYQDSNGVQEELIRRICRNPDSPAKSDVFMVGDVKQSIYGFRRANPELFIDKFNQYREEDKEGTLICLNSNYRSRPGVLNAINAVFEKLMTKDRGGIVYDDTAKLNPGALFPEDAQTTGPSLVIDLVIPTDTEKEDGPSDTEASAEGKEVADDPNETETSDDTEDTADADASEDNEEEEAEERSAIGLQAILIGKRIREIVDNAEFYDLKEGRNRKATYKDIAILMRSVKNAEEEFLPILRDEFGIDVVSTEGAAYFETPEVRDLICFLRILDNPLQDIPLATVMTSPMFDFTSEEMAKIRLGAPAAERFFTAVEGYAGGDVFLGKKIDRFLAIFRNLRERRTFSTIPELLEAILQKTDYRSRITAMPHGRGREINVNMLLLTAGDFEKTNYRGIDRFLRYIDRLKEKEIILSEPNKLSEEENVVRLMTVHKSKGLEFPFVFLAGAQKDLKRSDRSKSEFVYDPTYRVAFDCVDPLLSVKIGSNLKKIIRDKEQDENLYEEGRVLYVALTRAKEKLFVVGNMKEQPEPDAEARGEFSDDDFCSKPSYLNWILRCIQGQVTRTEMKPEAITYTGGDFEVILHPQKEVEKELASYKAKNASDDAVEDGTEASDDAEGEVTLSDAEALAEIEKRFSYVYPYAALGDQKAIVSVSEVKHRFMEEEGVTFEEVATGGSRGDRYEALEDAAETGTEDEEAKAPEDEGFVIRAGQEENLGALRGTATHNVMEHLDFAEVMRQDDRIAYIREQVDRLTEEGILDETMHELVNAGKIAWFFESDLAKNMAQAQEMGRLKREVRFLYAIPAHIYLRDYQNAEVTEAIASQPDQVLVRGIIDAFYIDEDGHPVIMDYKTDALPKEGGEEILTKRYLAQLKLYKEALESMMGTQVKACVLYSFALGKEIPLPV
ncbi:MAG: UvrD-helicase domain-containing protein [Lachnospiraceae bacterium]|nr:UvrD-helicase domain-containing protein [Lachnospiraceae bacterium]